MVIKVIELGPFGCRIDRGTAESLKDLPEGYEAKRIQNDLDAMVVYVEPVKGSTP